MIMSNERKRRFREDSDDRKHSMKRTIRSNWSELPLELLGEILRRLNFIDAARAKSVCSHWSSVSVSPSDNPTPWLLIPPRGGDIYRIAKGFSHLYNPADHRLHRTKTLLDQLVSEFGSSYLLIGCSHGFLIGLTKYDHDESSVVPFVSNPLIGTLIELPRIDHLMEFKWFGSRKAILTSAPVGRSGCAALVLLYEFDTLTACSCTPRDDSDSSPSSSSSSWTELGVSRGLYYDVSSAGGKIFALRETYAIEMWSSKPPFEKITTLNPMLRFWLAPGLWWGHRRYYMMPLLVIRLVSLENRKTVRFEMFRMDDEKENWIKAESLGKNRALFLGGGSHSVFVSAAAGNGVEADCIYYTADNWYGIKQDGPNVGVFSLREGRIIKEFTGDEFGVMNNNEWEREPPLHWLVPTP